MSAAHPTPPGTPPAAELRDDVPAATGPAGPDASGLPTAPPVRPRRRWEFWRSPADQPSWTRPALLGIAALAALLYAWNIASSGFAPFYSVAARSMSESWKAFLYGALDPGATITVDKIGGFLWPQALAARVFGFHAWSLTLPQVIEGVVTVLVGYRVVRRWSGEVPGILAAGMLTLTPVAASMFGHSMEDGSLTMCLVLAADAYQRAVLDARLRPLLAAGAWIGLGFQAKMLEAWVVLPALAAGYLVVAPAPLRRRLGQLLVAGVVTAAVSLSWVLLVTLTPAADRPYVDGSTDNSAFSMVFGYNGLNRFSSGLVGGSVTQMGERRGTAGQAGGRTGTGDRAQVEGFPGGPGGGTLGGVGGSGSVGFGGSGAGTGTAGTGTAGGAAAGTGGPQHGSSAASGAGGGRGGFGAAGGLGGAGGFRTTAGPAGGFGAGQGATKLLGSRFAPEIGWLYPLALLAAVCGLWWRRRAPRTDRIRGGFLMWSLWLLTGAAVLSAISVPHTAYLALLAPPLAALAATGLVMFWQVYRAGGRRAWVLPAAVAAEAVWACYLCSDYPDFLPWLTPLLVAAGAVSLAGLLAARLNGRHRSRMAVTGLVAALVTVLAAPAAWSLSVLDPQDAGSSLDAAAGPSGAGRFGGFAAFGGASRRDPGGLPAGAAVRPGGLTGGAPGRAGDAPGGLGGRGSGGRGFGGFGGTGTLTTAQRQLLAYTEAHRDGARFLFATDSDNAAESYILATGATVMPMGGFSGSVPSPTLAEVQRLVATGQLRYVLLGAQGGGGFARGGDNPALDAVRGWVRGSCTAVPASSYGGSTGTAGTAGTLYRCTAG